MPEKVKNDIVKFKDFHMQIMQSFMIIADFEAYTNELNQIKPYSFAMVTHCTFDEDKNELTSFIVENWLDNFFSHLNYHVNRINKLKTRPNPYSNPKAYKNNTSKTICLIFNKEILTDNSKTDAHSIKNKFPSLFQYFDDKALKLLRKGVYPYDYVDENWKNRLKEEEIPDFKYFHSYLSNSKYSDED